MRVRLNTLLLEVLVSYWSPRYSSQYLLCDTIHQLGWTQLPRGFWNSLASPEGNCCTQHLTGGKTPEAPWSRAPPSLQHQVPPQSPGGAPDKPGEREPGSSLHLHAGVGNQLAGASPGDQVRAAHEGDRGSHLGHPVTLAEPNFRSAPFHRQLVQCKEIQRYGPIIINLCHLLNNSIRAGPAGAAAQKICLNFVIIYKM